MRFWTEIRGPRSFSTHADGEEWDVELSGIVRVGPSFMGSSDCHVAFGTMVNRGLGLVATFGSGPFMQVLVDGEYHGEAELNACDASALKALGYDDIDGAEVTRGTTFAFHIAFPTDAAPDHLLIGHPGDPAQQGQLAVEVVRDIKPPSIGESRPIDSGLLTAMTAEGLVWEPSFGPHFEVRIDAVVRFDDGCVVVAGSFTALSDLDSTVEYRDQPRFALIADGRYERSLVPHDCHDEDAEAAGYQSPNRRTLATNVPHNFFHSFVVPANATIEAILVGDRTTSSGRRATLWLAADVSSELPAASTTTGGGDELPPLAGALGTSQKAGVTWEIRLGGIIETGPSSNADLPGRCIDIYGTMAPVALQDSASVAGTAGASTPEIGVLHSGEFYQGRPVPSCDHSAVEGAGHRPSNRLVVAGKVHPFHLTVVIPDGAIDAVIVGSDAGGGFTARPDFSTEVQPPDTSWSSPVSFDSGRLAGTTYEYTDRFTDWVYELRAMVEIETAAAVGEGRCFAVLGTVTPTRVSWTPAVTDPGEAPPIAAIGDGYMYWGGENQCEMAAVEQAGYSSLRSLGLAEGETAAFAAPFLLPGGVDIDVVTVGRATGIFLDGSEAIFVDPAVSAQIPPAD